MNYGSLKLVVGRKVNDSSALKYAESILDNTNAALRVLASIHTGLASTFDITGDGETTQFSLPGNCVDGRIQGVYHTDDDIWLTKVDFFPGASLDLGYYVWPNSLINFNPYIDEDDIMRLHYVAYYSEIATDADVLSIPTWAIEAVALYAAGRTLEDHSAQYAQLGQVRTRIDSGNPEDQPVLRLAERYIQQFYDLINQHPVQGTHYL